MYDPMWCLGRYGVTHYVQRPDLIDFAMNNLCSEIQFKKLVPYQDQTFS